MIMAENVATIKFMKFSVRMTESAIEDLEYFRKDERRLISDRMLLFLTHDANTETRRRKKMRPNPIAPWELRIDDHRVFYEIENNDVVKVIAIGSKVHNDLYIRGKKVEL